MQRREKILLIAVVSLLVIWRGAPLVWQTLFGPIEERRSALQILETKLRDKEDRQLAILRATRQLGEWKARSLPPDEFDAQRLYQKWLTDTAQLAGLKDLKVTPGRLMARKTYVGVQVAVEGKATLDQLTKFLDQFHRTDLLHRIVDLKIDSPASEGNPQFNVSLTAEGLALRDAPPRNRLFPEAKLAADLPASGKELTVAETVEFPKEPGFRIRLGNEYALVTKIDGEKWSVARAGDGTTAAAHKSGDLIELAPVHPEYAQRTAKEYQTLLAKNPFAKPAAAAAGPKQDDEAQSTELVAFWEQDGQAEAWLYDKKKNQRTILTVGSSFQISDISARVLEIHPDFVVLERNDARWTLNLGDNVRSMKQAPPAANEAQKAADQNSTAAARSTAG